MAKKLVPFDWAMKRLLRNKANFDILEGFLSELLKEDFKIKQILESEGNKETEDDKFNRVDILVENRNGELVIVEIQKTWEADYFQRMSYGTAKVIVELISAENIQPMIEEKEKEKWLNCGSTFNLCT